MSDSRDTEQSGGDASGERLHPSAVLLAAFRSEGEDVDEVSPWLSNHEFGEQYSVAGIDEPVYYDRDLEAALVVTGVGTLEAAITIEALVGSPVLNCADAYFLTVGSAGASPEVATLGSVFVNDYILDWDQKYRLAPAGRGNTRGVQPLPFKRSEEVCKGLNQDLVAAAFAIGSTVDLSDSDNVWRYRNRFDSAQARSPPSVAVGTSVSGSEFWHGSACSSGARRLAEHHGVSPYCTTEMEGFGTAAALERHGLLDQYLSIRGVSNFDRPFPGQDVDESIEQDALALGLCMENVYRVASAILSQLPDDWEQWQHGVPEEMPVPTP